MKKLLYLGLCVAVAMMLLGCAGLPKAVKGQSRKNAIEPETWKAFDKSGQAKFLQVQTTAPKSASGKGELLDGSYGERLLEIKVDPAIQDTAVEWILKNKGPSDVWIVAAGETSLALPHKIAKGEAVSIRTVLDMDHYTYIVVDNEGGGKTELGISAMCGETKAKTTRGKSMKIIWF